MEIKVSVVLLTYNHVDYIEKALKSILNQKVHFAYEVIIGDDASTDGTKEILKKYADIYKERIILKEREKNVGATRNFYDLLMSAQGKYIACIEGDDFWTDMNKLQAQYDFLNAHEEYIACTHDCVVVDENEKKHKKQKLVWMSSKTEFTWKDCKGFYLSGQTATLMFRNVFKNSDKDYSVLYKAHPVISDRTLQLILSLQGKIYHIDKVMSAYRLRNRGESENATNQIFTQNKMADIDNYEVTQRLEAYAESELKERINFTSTKRMFFINALCKSIIFRDKNILKGVILIIKAEKWKTVGYVICLPIEVILKVFRKIQY